MSKITLSIAALAITTGSAIAADLPSRTSAPMFSPPPAPAPLWTGFYMGLNAGGTWANNNRQTIDAGPVTTTDGWPSGAQDHLIAHLAGFSSAASVGLNSGANAGFVGGGQFGYNWQLYGSFVAGAEADIQGLAGNSGGGSVLKAVSVGDGHMFVSAHSLRGSIDYIGTVRGRVGWLFTPTLLLYGTGGFAYGGVSLNSASYVIHVGGVRQLPVITGGANFSDTQIGWTAGGGVEWMFLPNWSAKVEYLYYDLGTVAQNFAMPSVNAAGTQSAVFAGQARARVTGNIVRAGLNYHLNWSSPSPVFARF